MGNHRTSVSAVLAGAIAGVVVLGVIGRVVMAGVALVTGSPLNISMRGLLEVLFVGVLVGAIGGFLLLPVRSVVRGGQMARGAVLGALLFLGSFLFSLLWRMCLSSSQTVLPLTLVVVGVLFVIYGIAVEVLMTRLERDSRTAQ